MSSLATERLLLRPFRRSDAAEFARLAGDWPVASMTSDIPFPFTARQAHGWLTPVRGEVRYAIVVKRQLVGGVGFYLRPSGAAELGFWLGRPWWGRGFATEAARTIVRQGFEVHGVPLYTSAHFVDNPASGRVLAKLGFMPSGRAWIACAARGHDMEVLTFRLDASRAGIELSETASARRARNGWRSWLGRLV